METLLRLYSGKSDGLPTPFPREYRRSRGHRSKSKVTLRRLGCSSPVGLLSFCRLNVKRSLRRVRCSEAVEEPADRMDMPEEGLVDVKFRLYDGSDMGPFQYASSSTVDSLKQRIVSDWPKGCFVLDQWFGDGPLRKKSIGKTISPKAANEIKLISSCKVLENNKTVGQCKSPFGDVAGGCIVMHVVVQPSLTRTKTEKKIDDAPNKFVCPCPIL